MWMSGEAAVSLSAAWIARSPALLAFGGDSMIELLSAALVLWRFGSHAVQGSAERRASRIAGALLFSPRCLRGRGLGSDAAGAHDTGIHSPVRHRAIFRQTILD